METAQPCRVDTSSITLDLDLNAFLCSELDAVREHEAAIEAFGDVPYVRILRHNLASHVARVLQLERAIIRRGGIIVPGLASIGDGPLLVRPGLVELLDVLAMREARDRHMYALALQTADLVTRPFMRWLHAEQRDSHVTIADLQPMVAASLGRTRLATVLCSSGSRRDDVPNDVSW